jgi:hypothetical protein
MTRVRPDRRLVLLQVEQNNGESRPILVYQRVHSFLLSIMILRMSAVIKNDNKKLTRVISTKLSIEDYNRFVIYTWAAYSEGLIDEPEPSRFLRFISTVFFEGLFDLISPSSPPFVNKSRNNKLIK